MVDLLEKDWVLLEVSRFTSIMKIESIFISKILTYDFLKENSYTGYSISVKFSS